MRVRPTDAPDDPKCLGRSATQGIIYQTIMVARGGYKDDGEEPKANPIKEYRNVDRRELSGGSLCDWAGIRTQDR